MLFDEWKLEDAPVVDHEEGQKAILELFKQDYTVAGVYPSRRLPQ